MGSNTNIEDRSFNANTDNTTRQGNTWVPGESLPEPPPEPPALTGISVSPDTADLAVGGTQQLTVAAEPEGAVLTGATGASADEAVATVDGGLLVTGVAAGSTTITVTDGAASDVVEVTVAAVEE